MTDFSSNTNGAPSGEPRICDQMPPIRPPRIAVCVITFNSAPLIAELVASIPAGAAGTSWTLVVADNSSTDDTISQLALHAPYAQVVHTGGNLGYAAGVNAAVAAAGEQDAYLILNPDVRLHPDCVAGLWHALQASVGIAVPRLVDASGELIWSMRRAPTAVRAWAEALIGGGRAGRLGLGEVVTNPTLYQTGRLTEWAEGSTLLITAQCLHQSGPWDESFFLYSEETEFALRARDAGFLMWYEPSATATHLEGGSAESPRLWSLLMCNRVRFYRQRSRRSAGFSFWLALVLREASRTIIGKKTSRAALQDLLSRRRLSAPRGPAWLDHVRC